MTNVQCNFDECIYNEKGYCQCEEIRINSLFECDTLEIKEDNKEDFI